MAQTFEQPHEFQPKYNANEFLTYLKARPRNQLPDEKTIQAEIKAGRTSSFDQKILFLVRESVDGCKCTALLEEIVHPFEEFAHKFQDDMVKSQDVAHFLNTQHTIEIEKIVTRLGDHVLQKLPPIKHTYLEVMQYLAYLQVFLNPFLTPALDQSFQLLRAYIAAKFLAGNDVERKNILYPLEVFKELFEEYFIKKNNDPKLVRSLANILVIQRFILSINNALSLKKAQQVFGELCAQKKLPEVSQMPIIAEEWREIATSFVKTIFQHASNSFEEAFIACGSKTVETENIPHFVFSNNGRFTNGGLISKNPDFLPAAEVEQDWFELKPETKKQIDVLYSAMEAILPELLQQTTETPDDENVKNIREQDYKASLEQCFKAFYPYSVPISYDYRGEILDGNGFISSLPLRTVLGEHAYQILRTLIFSSVAPLVFTDYKTVRPLEEIIGDATEEDAEEKGKNKPKAPTIPIAMMRYFPRQNRQIHLNPEKIKVTKESDGDKGNGLDDTRYVSPHTRLLPPGYTPGRKAFDKVKNFGGRLHLFAWIHEKTTGQHIWLPIDDGDYDYFLNLKKKWQEEDFPANEFEIRFQTGAFPTTEPTQVILANVGREHRKLMADLLNTETQ